MINQRCYKKFQIYFSQKKTRLLRCLRTYMPYAAPMMRPARCAWCAMLLGVNIPVNSIKNQMAAAKIIGIGAKPKKYTTSPGYIIASMPITPYIAPLAPTAGIVPSGAVIQ